MTRQERATALMTVLSRPDPPDLLGIAGEPRGYRYTCAGNPLKRELIKRDLGMAYVQWRMHDAGRDISKVISVFRTRLRVVRRA